MLRSVIVDVQNDGITRRPLKLADFSPIKFQVRTSAVQQVLTYCNSDPISEMSICSS